MQRKLIQNKSIPQFLFSQFEKKQLINIQKQQLQKRKFSNVYFVGTTCFDKCFLFHVKTGSSYFLRKCIVNVRFFSTAMLITQKWSFSLRISSVGLTKSAFFPVAFFKTSVLKEVRILRYLRNNKKVQMPKSLKIMLSYVILIKFS